MNMAQEIGNRTPVMVMLADFSMALASQWLRELVNSVPDKVPVVSIIKLEGVIAAGGGGPPNPLMRATNINLDGIRGVVDSAFSQQNLKLVCLVINSPGGSPVQSDLVYRSKNIFFSIFNYVKTYIIS